MSELSFGEAENWVDFVERQIGYKFVNRDLSHILWKMVEKTTKY